MFDLHHMLNATKHPIPLEKILSRLECSQATFKRLKKHMVDFLGAPIEYDRNANGYFYQNKHGETFELPGLWFKPSELHALLIIQHQISHLQPGFLTEQLTPLTQKISAMLTAQGEDVAGNWHRLRILSALQRHTTPEQLSKVAEATLKRQKIKTHYKARTSQSDLVRELSPQRLVHYRDNWYLDAWCHTRNDLRTFSIDRLNALEIVNVNAKEVSEKTLTDYFTKTYGIFSGAPTNTAKLKFTAQAAQWVADEHWHPDQQGRWQADGSYELSIPYGDATELIMDILKHGEQVQVLSPAGLRKEVVDRLRVAIKKYSD